MESYSPIVALAGSARLKIMGIEQKETAARNACFRLGQELAKAGWRIAVYGDDKDYIEAMLGLCCGVLYLLPGSRFSPLPR